MDRCTSRFPSVVILRRRKLVYFANYLYLGICFSSCLPASRRGRHPLSPYSRASPSSNPAPSFTGDMDRVLSLLPPVDKGYLPYYLFIVSISSADVLSVQLGRELMRSG